MALETVFALYPCRECRATIQATDLRFEGYSIYRTHCSFVAYYGILFVFSFVCLWGGGGNITLYTLPNTNNSVGIL